MTTTDGRTHAGLDTSRPFTRERALAEGITARQLRSSRFRRLFTGIYIRADVPVLPITRAEAALLPFGPTAWASHATAARVWGLPIPVLPDEHVTVLERRERRGRDRIDCHLAAKGCVQVVDGVRISAPEQAFIELGSLLSLVDLVAVGDHLVRRGLVRLDRLRKFCAAATGEGAANARAAAAFVRERVDSPMETRLRMLIVLAGLPEPLVNITVGADEFGLERRKYDLCWPEARLVVEYDGRHHVERVDQWESDLERRARIDDDGWRIVVVVASGIYRTPGRTLAKIHRLLRERGHPGVPARLSDGWRPHFPDRG